MRQKKLCKELIQKDIDALERGKSNSIKKYNILEDMSAIFTGAYLHYEEVPQETTERSIANRVRLRKEKITEIKEEEKNIVFLKNF